MAGELAVVLSGGGAKGAFQVGVLDELIGNRGVRFDAFCGVSTGSIQALGGAMDDMPGLLRQWTSITGNGDVYKKRPLGAAGAAFGANSIYDAAPIKAKIRGYASPAKLAAANRVLRVGVVNLATGQYQDVDGTAPDIGEWVYASCAQPPFFQPLKTRSATGVTEQWVDGGVRNVTPLSSAMALRPRAVLVVLASAPKMPPQPGKLYDNLIEIALRCSGILVSEVSANDTSNAMLINDVLAAREAQMRQLAQIGVTGTAAARVLAPLDVQLSAYKFVPIRIIHPPDSLIEADTLEFAPAKIAAAIDAGRRAVIDQWATLQGFLAV